MSLHYFKMLFLVIMVMFYDTNALESGSCDAISSSLTAKRTGQKAWDKCIEYQEKYVYPCEESPVPGESPHRGDYCKHDSLVQNNSDSPDNEYNYVVSLGFGNETNTSWISGGTVISEKYILTGGHSVYNYKFGIVKFVYLGTPGKNEDIDQSRLYKIKEILKHPDYERPKKYHDIALIETEELMKLNKFMRPACLHTGEPLNYDEATLVSRDFIPPINVIELKLTKLSNEECSNRIPPNRFMISGFADEWQMCYEDKNYMKNKYRADGGCPLQVKSDKINCMNIVIGVASFARSQSSEWTVFTRVSHYVPWIESIVWP